MALIIENGTLVADANSYVTEDEFTSYAALRGQAPITTDARELLIKAMDYLESLQYQGMKVSAEQALQWPRSDVYIDGYYFSQSSIPKEIKAAQMATALAINSGFDPLAPVAPAIKRTKVDVLETEYQDGAASSTFDPKITAMLSKLTTGGSSMNFNVVRV